MRHATVKGNGTVIVSVDGEKASYRSQSNMRKSSTKEVLEESYLTCRGPNVKHSCTQSLVNRKHISSVIWDKPRVSAPTLLHGGLGIGVTAVPQEKEVR